MIGLSDIPNIIGPRELSTRASELRFRFLAIFLGCIVVCLSSGYLLFVVLYRIRHNRIHSCFQFCLRLLNLLVFPFDQHLLQSRQYCRLRMWQIYCQMIENLITSCGGSQLTSGDIDSIIKKINIAYNRPIIMWNM